jgi:hypothetical protein
VIRELLRRPWAREALPAAPAAGLFTGLALYRLLPTATWVGDVYDEGGYFLMSRNVWEYGRPLLDQTGEARWPRSWSPALSVLLSPFGALPMDAAVVAERVVILLTGIALIAVAFLWLRELGLSRAWAGTAAACIAAGYPLVVNGSRVLSDVPAAAALLAGVLLLRRGRLAWGTGLVALAGLLRPVNLAPLAAVALWLLLEHRSRRVVGGLAVTGALVIGLIVGQVATGGFRGYFEQIGETRLPGRIYVQGKTMLTRSGGESIAGAWSGQTLLTEVRPLLTVAFVALLVAAAVGLWRRRALLEALVIGATVAALLFYPAGSASLSRYLIPIAPLLIGGIAAAFAGRGATWTAVAAAGAALALASDVWLFHRATPSPGTAEARVASWHAAYGWIRTHAGEQARVVASNDIRAFLYSGHPAVRTLGDFPPGRTFLIDPARYFETRVSDRPRSSVRGRIVFRRGAIEILRVDGLR